MLQKSSAQLLGVTAKQNANGIGDNVQVYMTYESSLKPYSYVSQSYNLKIISDVIILQPVFNNFHLITVNIKINKENYRICFKYQMQNFWV